MLPDAITATGVVGAAPALDQRAGHVADLVVDLGEHERVGRTRSPVDLAGDVDDLDAALAPCGEWHASMRRDRGHAGHAGDDLERNAGLGAGQGLVGTGGVHERVALQQPDDVTPALGGGERQPAPHRSRQWQPVVVDAAIDDLDVVGCVSEQSTVARVLDHDDVGLGENLDGAEGQQAGIARSGSDEGNAAHDWTLPGGHRTVSCSSARSWAPTSAPAPSSSISAARSRPSCSAAVNGPVADLRMLTAPSGDTATARR